MDPLGKPGIYVVTFYPEFRARLVSGCLSTAVSPKPLQHQLHHVALPMVRWRRVGKDEQFHFSRKSGLVFANPSLTTAQPKLVEDTELAAGSLPHLDGLFA